MRYKKNFYYTNIEYTNTMVGGFVGENENFVRQFNGMTGEDFKATEQPMSVVEFGCDLGNRIDNISAKTKLGIEFDHVADLYADRYMKSPRFMFQTPDDFLSHPFPYKEKYDCGFCLDFFDIFDSNYDRLVEKMLTYCNNLYIFSKDRSAKQMSEKITSNNIDYMEYYIPKGLYEGDFTYNVLLVEEKGGVSNVEQE